MRLEWSTSAVDEIEALPAADRSRIVDEIKRHLPHEALVPSKKRKCLASLLPSFEADPPIWELKVVPYRVFYDVNASEDVVHIRAIRIKRPEDRTEDIA